MMKKINEKFKCINCGKQILPANKTCRNHCPHCFASLHVDEESPGDRASSCQGTMFPVEYVFSNGITKILFVCTKCGKKHRNKASDDDNLLALDDIVYKYKNLI